MPISGVGKCHTGKSSMKELPPILPKNQFGSSGKSVPAYRETSLRLTKKRCVGD
jgi:hypothetical protein